ncbi:hypothetical protein IJ818_00165 [bacterium]|nr:hypothetical protein [bacterium]
MGIAANQARLMTLTARQHDLELRAQQISAQKMVLTYQSQQWASEYSTALNDATANKSGGFDQDAINAAKSKYDAAMTSLSSQEKLMDMELTQINTEHQAVKTEYDSIKSLIGDNVEKSFNVFG